MRNSERALASTQGEIQAQRCPTCGAPRRQRSDASHRHFFAILHEAWKQWPESEGFQPEDAEHLRAFLLVKAKHCDRLDVKCKSTDAIGLKTQLDVVIRAFCDGKPPLMHAYPWGIRIFKPRSISYASVDRKTFQSISQTVFEIIETTIGRPVDELRREADREAA